MTNVLFVAVALCAVAGPVFAQEWKAHRVPLFAAATNASDYQGFVRVINRSDAVGEVIIDAVDDAGVPSAAVTLRIGAGETVHFNSDDLEDGNAEKGLSGGIGTGTGDWRLRLRSQLDLEVLAYNRTSDGLLAPLHDVVPREVVRRPGTGVEAMGHRVAVFNPASNVNQVSRLRIINAGDEAAAVTIEGIDDDGESPGTAVELEVAAGASRMVASQVLESGRDEGLAGMLDDGAGKWQLVVTSDQPVEVMSLLSSPTGHLTNLSTAPGAEEENGSVHDVLLFAAAESPHHYQGFVRVINHSGEGGEVAIEAFDDEGVPHGPVTLDIDAKETVHFNSDDLEEGNPDKGLSEGVGEGTRGDWRLRLSSPLDIEVLAYNRTDDGLLTTLHDVVPYTETIRRGEEVVEAHYVAIFNPASNVNQVSRLRIVNPGTEPAAVSIEGIDDDGQSPGTPVELTVPAWAARTLTSQELETGRFAEGLEASGGLGDGTGKWRLVVSADRAIETMSLMSSPTGHLVNLSTGAPAGEVVPAPVVAMRAAIEIAGRSTASTGTPVELSVRSVGMSDVAVERYGWVFSDGQRRSGEEVSVRFADAGVVEVTVSAMSGTDVVAQATSAVAVFDAAVGANPGFAAIPPLFGDVNQDERFSSADLELAEQAVAGLAELEVEAIEAGDLDFSGELGERDVELMRQALDRGSALPSALLDAYAYPGGTVAMVSPALHDPDTDVAVYVDGVASPRVMRAILGYATFEVPASLMGEDAEVDVVLQVYGVVAERLRLVLKPAIRPTVSAREDVLEFLAELAGLIAKQEKAGAEFIEQNADLSAEDTAIVLGAAKAAAEKLRSATTEIEALLNGEVGDELSALVQTGLYANGLADFRAQAQEAQNTDIGVVTPASSGVWSASTRSLSVQSVQDVCTSYLPAVCALQRSVAALSWGSSILIGICRPGPLALFVFGAPGAPKVQSFATSCLSVYVAMRTATALGMIVNSMVLDARLTSDKDTLRGGDDAATISAQVVFSGLRGLCGSQSAERMNERIRFGMERIVRNLVIRVFSLSFLNRVNRLVYGPNYLLGEVSSVLGAGLTMSRFHGAFRRSLDELCDALDESPVDGLTADGRHFNLQVSSGGVLVPKQDGTGTYRLSCRRGFSGTLEVSGSKDLCGAVKNGVVQVACWNGCPRAPYGEVNIPDAGLRAAVEEALGKPAGAPITQAEMESLRSMDASGREVRSLAGLGCATELTWLNLTDNGISDVSPLSRLTALEVVILGHNQIMDVGPLSGLTALEWLYLNSNQISDVTPLSRLTTLGWLGLRNNQISDVSPLSSLANLESLDLGNNRISDLSPLSGLTALESLVLHANQVSDVSPLSDLTSLKEWLELSENRISNLSPLSGLTAVKFLGLGNNQISNVSPLSGLTALRWLNLRYNRISNIGALVSNSGLGHGDVLVLEGNPLSCSPMRTMMARGVCVFHVECELPGVPGEDNCGYSFR